MFTLGDAFGTSLRLWARHLPRYLVLTAIFYLPLVGWQLLGATAWGQRVLYEYYVQPLLLDYHPALYQLGGSAMWIMATFLSASVAVFVVAKLRGERAPLARSIGLPLRRAVAVLAAGAVVHVLTTGVIVVGALVLWTRDEWFDVNEVVFLVGAIAWIVLSSLVFATLPAMIAEHRGPLSALRRAFVLARGHRVRVFAIVLVGHALLLGIALGLRAVLLDLAFEGSPETARTRFVLHAWISLAIELLAASLWAVARAVVYERLRAAREGPASNELQRVFA